MPNMSGSGVEQASGIRHPQPPPFGRQSSAPTYGQSASDAHSSSSSFEVSPITPFPPSTTLTNTTYPSRRSGLDSTRAASSTHLPSGGQTDGLTGRDSPDPDDYYRQTGPLSAPLKASFGDVMDARYSMATAPSNLNERVSAVPANVLDPSRARRPIPRSISDSPTLGGPLSDVSSTRPSMRARQPSFRDLVNKFNNTSDSVLPLPSTSRSTSRTASPTGSDRGSSNTFSRRQQPRESLPSSLISNNPRLEVESPQTQEVPNNSTSTVPPPLFQRVSEPHSRRYLFGELSTLNTEFDNQGLGVPAHARRRGSEGSIASPNPAFLNHANPGALRTPLTPTAWYLGQAHSLEAVQSNANKNLSHRRSRSDFVSPFGESLADPWNPEMAVSAPLQQGKPGDGSPGSPNSRSRIPISSHRFSSGSGSEPLSPTANLTFSNRSNTIPLAPKGTSRLPKPLPGNNSPPRMMEDGPASFSMTARGRRDMAIGRTRHSVTVPDRSKLLQAYVSAPPPKKSPPLRSSRPRQTVSIAGPPAPRSPEIGRRLSSLQKVADRGMDRSSRRSRQLPELGNVDFETRRQRIQQAFNRTVQENERKEEEAAELRRRTRVDMVPECPEDEQKTPNTTINNIPLPTEMATTVTKPTQFGAEDGKGPHNAPQLHLNGSVSIPEKDVVHTTMDSPTLGLPDELAKGADGVKRTDSAAPDSPDSDGTHIDLEPQTHLISRKPSAAETHRTLLNHIMQIRESSSSSECDEADCSLSETDEKQSIKLMLRGQTYFRTSSSVNAEEAAQATLQHAKAIANPSDHRWSMSSWESSLQNQDSPCDEQCDEDSGDDLILQKPTPAKEEPPAEPASTASTRPASFADDEHEDGPLQDLGLTGPSTLAKAQFTAANFFATPPSLAKKGKWDSRRATQLYLEQLTQGRTADLGIAATRASPAFPPARASPSLPSVREPPVQQPQLERGVRPQENQELRRRDVKAPEMQVEPPKDNLSEEPVVVPRFQEPTVTAARNSHTASLVGPDDWEDASPSIMDWMQVAAEGDGVTPAEERGDFMADGPGVSNAHISNEAADSLDPSIARKALHVKPQAAQQPQIPPTARDATHSAQSSEDSLLRPSDQGHSDKAADSSSTSLDPYSEHLLRADQKKASSPSPEQRRLKKRRNVIKELVDTEHTFGRDMKVVEDIYKGTSGSCLDLSPDDVKILFGNSAEIAQFSQTFQDALKQAARSIYVMPKSQRWSSKRNTKGPVSQPVEEQTAVDAGVSDLEKDRGTSIGEAFITHMIQMEKVYSEYLKNYDSANKKLQLLQRNPKVVIWLRECRQWAVDLTTAWDLDSLLVKPVQRILKYPLLLNELLDATPNDHPDRIQLMNARAEVTNASVRINEMKKRADVVGQVVGRKRNQSDVRAGLSKAFGRRTEKFRQQVGMSDMYEDREYDALAAAFGDGFFQLQVVMRDVEMYAREMTKAMDQLNAFIQGIEAMMNVSPSNYPELESKWRQFKAATKDVTVVALPEHLALVRDTVVEPIIALLKLHQNPQKVMKKRDKRLLDYGRLKAITDRGDKPDKKTAENGEQFIALNETLKEELPKLYKLTAKLVGACLKNFVQVSTTFWDVMQKKVAPQVDIFPDEWEQVISDWGGDYTFAEAQVLSLGICNGSLLADSVNLVNFNTPAVGGVNSPRRPSITSTRRTSTANSSTHRPGSIAEESPHASQEYGVGSLFQSPRVDSFSGTSRHRSGSTFSGRGPSDSPESSRNLQQVTQAQPSASSAHDSQQSNNPEGFSSLLPALSIDEPWLPDILNVTSIDHDRPPTPSRYSGFFSSAMPMSDNPNESETVAPQDAQIKPAKEPQVLFLAASLYEFNIDKARREAGYIYLTYVAGEIFDVIGEKGELWLARNQDDSSNQVGWIWNKHFAKLSS